MFSANSRQTLYQLIKSGNWPLWFHAFFLSVIIVSHDFTSVSNPQFWAEDGAVWYREAYESGVASLFREQNGYYQSLPRLVALLATFMPLAWGPAIFVLASFIFQLMPSILLLSPRMDKTGVSRRARLVLAYFCVAAPNAWEIHLNLTNSQWFLALSSFLLIFADPAASFRGRLRDAMIIILGAFSGPFSIWLAPVAVWRWLEQRSRFGFWCAAFLSLGAALQTHSVLLAAGTARSGAPLGASVTAFAEVVTGQILLAGTVGQNAAAALIKVAGGWFPPISVLLALLGIAAVLAAWQCEKSSVFRAFLLFAAAVLAAALLSPQVSLYAPQWSILAVPGNGGRYFFIPIVAWFACALVLMVRGKGPVRAAAFFLGGLFAVGVIGDWVHVPLLEDRKSVV